MFADLFSVDIRTVLFLLSLGNLSAAGLLLVYGRHLHESRTSLLAFSKCLQGLAWLLLGLRGLAPDALSVLFGNILLYCGFWYEAECVRALDQPAPAGRGLWRAMASIAGLVLITAALVPQPNLRMAVASLGAALAFAVCGLRLLRGGLSSSALRRLLGWAYLLGAATMLLRLAASAADPEATLLTSGAMLTFSYPPLFLMMIAGTVGLLLLLKEGADRELARLATRDPLTGAPNRRALIEAGGRLMAQARRDGQSLGVLMLDIDRFKLVNDTRGHAVGDLVLRDLARVLHDSLRPYDAYGRFGGEEFVAVLPRAGRADALAAAERIRAAVEKSRPVADLTYTVSIGVAWGPPGADGLDPLLILADQAMYRAKAEGRNRVCEPGAEIPCQP
jgi:diguanylate cyclase (GGDEF)-like protein